MSHSNYGIDNVVGGFDRNIMHPIPVTLARTYKEHQMLRTYMGSIGPFSSATEFGCGYGRNLPVLREFTSSDVIGLEADPELGILASFLYPNCARVMPHVGTLPTNKPLHVPSASQDFVLTFTFLQHLQAVELFNVASEITRVTKTGGHLLLVEETDPGLDRSEVRGRSVETYAELFLDFVLRKTDVRFLEPSNATRDGGHYMLFEKRKSER